MRLDPSPEQQAFRDELRDYFDRLITPRLPDLERERRENLEGGGPVYTDILHQMGADGMLGIGWPREYGGQGRGPIEQYLFTEARSTSPSATPRPRRARTSPASRPEPSATERNG